MIRVEFLLVDPRLRRRRPLHDSFWEPRAYFSSGPLRAVTSMNDVTPNVDTVVCANRARRRVRRLRRPEEAAAAGYGILALPDHADDRARDHVGHEAGEELLLLQVTLSKKEG